jgi:hypothetical protein
MLTLRSAEDVVTATFCSMSPDILSIGAIYWCGILLSNMFQSSSIALQRPW